MCTGICPIVQNWTEEPNGRVVRSHSVNGQYSRVVCVWMDSQKPTALVIIHQLLEAIRIFSPYQIILRLTFWFKHSDEGQCHAAVLLWWIESRSLKLPAWPCSLLSSSALQMRNTYDGDTIQVEGRTCWTANPNHVSTLEHRRQQNLERPKSVEVYGRWTVVWLLWGSNVITWADLQSLSILSILLWEKISSTDGHKLPHQMGKAQHPHGFFLSEGIDYPAMGLLQFIKVAPYSQKKHRNRTFVTFTQDV